MPKLVSATYHLDVKTAEYIADNGDHLLRSGGAPAWRFNNPGNMRPARRRKITTSIGRATMRDGGVFLIFPDYETGRSELKRLLKDPDGYGETTLADTVPVFAPKQDGNDPKKYLHSVIDRTSIAADTKLGMLLDAQLDKLADCIETLEGYHAYPSTRSEKWVKGANITLSDGARPIAGQQVVVRQGGRERVLTTGTTGALPTLVLSGGSVDILIQDAKAQLQKVMTVGQAQVSKSYLLVREMFTTEASTAPHVPLAQSAQAPRAPITYRIEPHDSLSKIASRFKTSVAKLEADNHLGHSDLIIVGKTLVIYGASSQGDAAAAKHKSAPAKRAPHHAPHATKAAHSAPGAAHASTPSPASTPASASAPESASAPASPSSASSAATAHVDVPRTQAGLGRPLVLLPPDQPRASWMAIAIEEAERWGGADETVITKTMNYHAEIDDHNPFKTLSGSRNAWCAAFVNWVMKQDGRAMVAARIDRHRARKFVGDPSFPEIKQPIFGAIAVEANLGHVMFVYGIDPKTGRLVVLGGNQGGGGTFGGTIDFAEFKLKEIHGYYVPLSYLPFAQQEIARGAQLPQASAEDLNKLHHIKDPKGHGTR